MSAFARRSTPCPSAFFLAAHTVVLVGSDVAEALADSSVRVVGAVWENISALEHARAGICVEDVAARAFWNVIAHPVWFSLAAVQAAAGQTLGVVAQLDPLTAAATIKDLVHAEWRRSGGGIAGLLKVWLHFVAAYARKLDESRALLGFAGALSLGAGPSMPVLARGLATLTAFAPGSVSEEAPQVRSQAKASVAAMGHPLPPLQFSARAPQAGSVPFCLIASFPSPPLSHPSLPLRPQPKCSAPIVSQGGELVSQKVTADRTRALLVRTLNVQRTALGGRISDWCGETDLSGFDWRAP